jgi:hypothetical protein
LTLPSKELLSWVSVAHTCNLNYLGGWNWEDCVSRPAYTSNS